MGMQEISHKNTPHITANWNHFRGEGEPLSSILHNIMCVCVQIHYTHFNVLKKLLYFKYQNSRQFQWEKYIPNEAFNIYYKQAF
jgi:hypothetical protein